MADNKLVKTLTDASTLSGLIKEPMTSDPSSKKYLEDQKILPS